MAIIGLDVGTSRRKGTRALAGAGAAEALLRAEMETSPVAPFQPRPETEGLAEDAYARYRRLAEWVAAERALRADDA
ncbi:MAG: hypothetical protein HY321_04995 [Armatimonadetes bacterium]|nr:hypothetical protein [Armatimonadota bacterium]